MEQWKGKKSKGLYATLIGMFVLLCICFLPTDAKAATLSDGTIQHTKKFKITSADQGIETSYSFEVKKKNKNLKISWKREWYTNDYNIKLLSPSGEVLCNKSVEDKEEVIFSKQVSELGEYTVYIMPVADDFYDLWFDENCTLKIEELPIIEPTSIKMSKTKLDLIKGSSEVLSVSYTPSKANASISWSSSNTKVATVDSKGKVTAKAKGTATISAKCGKKVAKCTVKVVGVQKKTYDLKKISGDLREGNKKKISFNVPTKSQVSFKFTDDSYGYATLLVKKGNQTIWTRSNVYVPYKNKTYMMPFCLDKGTYTLVIECPDYRFGYDGLIRMNTVSAYKAKKVTLNKKTINLTSYSTVNLKEKVTPYYTVDKVKWSSSNKKVASVNSSGKVTAKAMGTATIKVKVGSKVAKCTIKVRKDKLQYWKGSSESLSSRLKNVAGYKNAKWTSSNKSVVSVNSKGKITAKKHGHANITATIQGVKYTFVVYSYDKKILKQNAIDDLKSRLKNPNSLIVNEVSYTGPGLVWLDYSAMNGFGGYNRKTLLYYCLYGEYSYI